MKLIEVETSKTLPVKTEPYPHYPSKLTVLLLTATQSRFSTKAEWEHVGNIGLSLLAMMPKGECLPVMVSSYIKQNGMNTCDERQYRRKLGHRTRFTEVEVMTKGSVLHMSFLTPCKHDGFHWEFIVFRSGLQLQ